MHRRKTLSRSMTMMQVSADKRSETKTRERERSVTMEDLAPTTGAKKRHDDATKSSGVKKAGKAKKEIGDTIQVGIRCRPLIGRDAGEVRAWDTQKRGLSANDNAPIAPGKEAKDKIPWIFDNVFDEQSDVYEIHEAFTSSLTDACLEGFHGTIFAYGQTGSGKTYTMVGDRAHGVAGVMSLSTEQIFNHIRADVARQYMVRVSYMEIYNEKVRDLLNPATAGEELKVREDPKTGFYVECQEVAVTNDDQIYAMLDAGNELRTVGATNMNAQSSRSHAIFRLVIESSPKEGVEQEGTAEENAFRSSYLNLVDLAGSERTKDTGAAGARLKEAGNINLSLSCLSNIIRALADASMKKGKAKSKVHLPFRNSKLTQILQPSLGGNSRTAFVCTVTLAARFYEDTKSTLAFADRAKKVTNKPKKNILVNEKAMLQEAQDEIAQLKRALALAENGTTLPGDMTAAGGNDVETDTMEHQTLVNKIKFLESMMIGAGGAQQLDIMHEMWTPEMGSSAFDSNEAAKLLKEAEIKRVEEFRTVQRKEIEKVWEEVDADGSGTLDPDELKDVFAKMGQSDVDVPSVLAEIDDDGNGEVDFNEFFEWWCTRTVADRERLKGTATALDGPSSTRIAKLKVRLKIAARLCGAVSANRAKDRTVSAAQLIKGMSGIGMGPTAGKAAESREAKRKVEALRKELYAAKDEIKRKDADLEQQAARFDAQAGELSALRAKLENAEEAATNSAEGRAAADRDAVQLGNKVADLEAELSNVHAALAVSQAHAEELEQKTDQQRVAAGLEVAQSNQAAATLRSQLSSRDATIVTLSGKIATLEAEVAELQHAIVELAVDERVKETERLRIDLANRKAQADEQIEQLRQNVVSARYMQTLYSTTKPGLIEHDSTNMVSSHVSASSFSTNSPRVGSRSNADIPFSPTSPHATSLRRKAARAWSTDATSTLRSEADMSAATGADAAKEMMALLGLPQNSNA